MANQRQFRSDDTSQWLDKYGSGASGNDSVNTSSDANGQTTASGTGGSTSLSLGGASTFANNDLIIIAQIQGSGQTNTLTNWELNKISSGGGSASLTLAYTLTNSYTTGSIAYQLKPYANVTVNSGQTVTSNAWGGGSGGIHAYIANQSITVTGNINNAGAGFRGGVEGGQNAKGQYGEGYPGPAANASTSAANGNGGGADPNGGELSSGAGGGYATSGGAGVGAGPPAGGGTAANTDLTIVEFGGAGASGSWNINNHAGNANGGNGGGFILLIAPVITVTGGVSGNGSVGNSATDDNGLRGFAGGGGAGGSILLKCNVITGGSNLITATGANGGTGSGSSESHPGGNGGNGRIHIDYGSTIGSTVTNPTAVTRLDPTLSTQGALFFSEM